jgi:outer membrane receptor for monomeric catechols
MDVRMRLRTAMTIAIIAACLCDGGFALARERPRHAPSAVQRSATSVHDSDVSAGTPYKADRLSSFRGQSAFDAPGQTTVLTREMLDDMNATTLKDALRSTAGVTVR